MNLRRVALALFVVALALVPVLTPASNEFLITQANYIGLYTLVVIGLVLLTGIAAMTSAKTRMGSRLCMRVSPSLPRPRARRASAAAARGSAA